MEEINNLLNFDNLRIVQNSDWFKFSIDSVLLADFVKTNNKMNIIDFCTGNAPIPLFLSKKTKSKIVGVEIQKEIFKLAKKSVNINSLENQIEILNYDVKKLDNLFETDSFDLITCNPPYFKSNNIYKNKNSIKSIARHEIFLNLDDIFKIAKKILKNNGKIAIINRTDRLIDVITKMKEYNIEPKRLKFIFPKEDSDSNLFLIEGSKNGKSGLILEKNIIIHNNDNSYKNEILNIFNGGKNDN